MRQVLFALLPGIVLLTAQQGVGVLLNLAWASLGALLGEALSLKLRHRPILPTLQDNSALVTAWLLALCLPPQLPAYLPLLGALFAIVVAKQLYGGLGHNIFNPAMAGYVFLLLAFPLALTRWPETPLPPLEALNYSLTGILPAPGWDALSHATPLDQLKQVLRQNLASSQELAFTWAVFGWLLGGIYLGWQGIIRARLTLLTLLGFGLAALGGALAEPQQASPLWHLSQGGIVFAAVFIVTDPVTAPSSLRAQTAYALGIGALAYLLRAHAAAPEALAFAVLLGNAVAPALERYLARPNDAR